MSIFKRTLLSLIVMLNLCYADDIKQLGYENDADPNIVLDSIKQTRMDLLYDVNGIKIPKIKDEREGFYGLFSIGFAHSSILGKGLYLNAEAGYDFIFKKRHSLRVFAFIDRAAQEALLQLSLYNANLQNAMQVYRAGISAEYRIYVNANIAFRTRLASLGSNSIAYTDGSIKPVLTTSQNTGIFATIAFGPVFIFGRHHELFVGYDLINYDKNVGMNVNYLKYSFRF